jgi:hypothetical protein
LVLAVLIAGSPNTLGRARGWLAVPVLVLPMVTITVTLHALIARYYF